MDNDVNPKIIEKIDKSESDKSIKEFLKWVINLEFCHSEESRWRFGEEYESSIKKFMPK